MRSVDFQPFPGQPLIGDQLPAPSPQGHGLAEQPPPPVLGRRPDQHRSVFRAGAAVLALALLLAAAVAQTESAAQAVAQDAIKNRNIGGARSGAAQLPRSEGDQKLTEGWPLYRSERGQTAFNDAMATLQATEGAAPPTTAFKGCAGLECNLTLPALTAEGWIPPGRIWVSPTEYVLIAHSPRPQSRQSNRRRSSRDMRYFVFHEFHNGTRNTDPYDTISSHSGSVFVPLYMSKQATDAKGYRFVVVVQVAPHDVVSIHASDKGSAGPGIEVAKNVSDALEPLQGLAGILVATIVKTAVPQLRVVNHRGTEGLPMLTAYERRLATLRAQPGAVAVTLPFVSAPPQRVAAATGGLEDLILRRGATPRIPVAERGIVPPKAATPASATVAHLTPALTMSPLAAFLKVNLATMKQLPVYANVIPGNVTAIAEESPEEGIVYLLDAGHEIIGRIEPHQANGTIVRGKYVYAALDKPIENEKPFDLDLSRSLKVRSASLAPVPETHAAPALVEPIRPALPPAERRNR